METAETIQSTDSAASVTCICQAQPLMAVADAALLLDRSKEYLYCGLREKRFPGATFGRSRRISRAFVEAFVAQVVRGGATDFEEYAAAWLARTATEVVA